MPLSACPKLAEAVHYLSCVGAFRLTSCRERQSEGEGACLLFLADRSHLPLRGKLGWMTPRAGVKTTPATETRLTGPPDPKRGPHFFSSVESPFDKCTCIATETDEISFE